MNVELIRSRRKSLAIEITSDGKVKVRAPLYMPESEIEDFLQQKSRWIEEHLWTVRERIVEQKRNPEFRPLSSGELKDLADRAKEVLPQKVRYYAEQIGVTYGRITIRNQKTRWGSCSAKGNLNFNCLLMLAPEEVQNYVVIHELCHRREMNHSPGFWAEVERFMPDYRIWKNWLKKNGEQLIMRM